MGSEPLAHLLDLQFTVRDLRLLNSGDVDTVLHRDLRLLNSGDVDTVLHSCCREWTF